jgi:1,4-dihydroxy-2-naphthoyl-CoA synthase
MDAALESIGPLARRAINASQSQRSLSKGNMTFENVLMEVKDQVAWITVNRPPVLNALNHKTMDGLSEAGGDHDVRAFVS